MRNKLYWLLRIACFGIYLGHGMFGVLGGKAAWLPYFHFVGIPDHIAWPLMRIVGVVDVASAFIVLFKPTRPVLLYMIGWGFWTALLRPLVGEGWWECLERFPNWIVPLAFFGLQFFDDVGQFLHWCLRLGTAVHFIGHGGYGAFVHKPAWTGYFGAFGLDPATVQSAGLVSGLGWAEIILGVIILVAPVRVFLIAALVLMAFDPGARLFVGEPAWEFIERSGNMVAPLALMVAMAMSQRVSTKTS